VALSGVVALFAVLLLPGHGEATSRVTDEFIVPVGSGDGQIAYITEGTDPWGPISFCVLPDKSVAIVDAGNQRIQVFDRAGSFQYSVDLAGIVVSPTVGVAGIPFGSSRAMSIKPVRAETRGTVDRPTATAP